MEEILCEVEKRIDNQPPPPPGQRGRDGEKGAKGEKGDPGSGVDVDKLADAVISALPKILIQYSDGNPSTEDRQVSIRLGETIVIPPQKLRIRDGDKTFELTESLGEALKIKVEGLLSANSQ